MGNIFNEDFKEFITTLNLHDVQYLLIGGYSVVLHGYPRTTGDMDIWVHQTESNYMKIREAFLTFGLPIMPLQDFTNSDHDVFTYGRPPHAIDLMTQCKGLSFLDTYTRSELRSIDDIKIRLISKDDLIKAKKSAGRYKDLNDIEHLED